MKIGINATILDPKPSGLGNYTINLINNLTNIINDYIVFSSYFERLQIPSETCFRVNTSVRPSLGRFGHLSRWGWLQFVLPIIRQHKKVDIIFSTVSEGVAIPKIKQVIVVHDLSPLIFPEIYPRLNKYYQYFLPKILSNCDYIISDSKFTKEEIIKYYNIEENKIVVIHLGCDSESVISFNARNIKEKYNLDEFIICVASELSPRKNLPYLIKTISPLLKKLYNYSQHYKN
jgi:glycosyltransferase involved in cell wall biosynthesis